MDEKSMLEELKSFHFSLFKFFPDSDLQRRYIAAHAVYEKHFCPEQQKELARCIQENVDLVSLEIFLRLKNKKNILTQKFLVIFYLTEVRADYQHFYISSKNEGLAFGKLFCYVILSIYRFIKGAFLYGNLGVLFADGKRC